jgi:Leu/Phe-tRNA-protein transferase
VSISGFITGVFLAAENNKDRPVRWLMPETKLIQSCRKLRIETQSGRLT